MATEIDPRSYRTQHPNAVPDDFGNREDDYFVINDIALIIPPDQITVSKRSHKNDYSSLRTTTTQKMKSGHAIVEIGVSFYINGIDQVNDVLIPLYSGLMATPFCVIHNQYLYNQLTFIDKKEDPLKQEHLKRYSEFRPVALAITNLQVSTLGHEGLPETLHVQMQFVWFNYYPMTPIFAFKKEDGSPGFAWESDLWKAFYQPFLAKCNRLSYGDWPHNQALLSSLSIGYKEFATAVRSQPSSLKAAATLTKLLQEKPSLVIDSLRAVIRAAPDTDSGITEGNFLDLTMNHMFRNRTPEELSGLYLSEKETVGVTQVASSLLKQTLSRAARYAQQGKDPKFIINQAQDELKAAENYFKEQIKKSEDLTQKGSNITEEFEKHGYKEYLNVDAYYPVDGEGSVFAGGLSVFEKLRVVTIGPEADESVIEQFIFSVSNNVVIIPMAGYTYPTLQFVGGTEASLTVILNSPNDKAANLSREYDNIENISLKFKQVPQGFRNIIIKNDFVELFGITEYITESFDSKTIPGQPGRSQVVLQFSQAPVTSRSKIEDPDPKEGALMQEFVRTSNDILLEIWKVIQKHLQVIVDKKGKSTTDTEYYYLERINVHNDIRNAIFAKLIDEARDNYNRLVKEVHSELFGISASTNAVIDRREKVQALKSIGNGEEGQDPRYGLVPNISKLRESIQTRLNGEQKNIKDSALGATSEGIGSARLKANSLQQQNFTRAKLAQEILGVRAEEQIDQEVKNFAEVERTLQELGVTDYIEAQRQLLLKIQDRYLLLDQFAHIAKLMENQGIQKGMMAYPDFKEQIRSMVQFSNPERAQHDASLIDYDPDAYLWYPILDGSTTGLVNINNYVDPTTVLIAKNHSINIFETAQGDVDNFFTARYRGLLEKDKREFGPYQNLKTSTGGSDNIKLSQPYYSGKDGLGATWQNNLNDPGVKSVLGGIQKTVLPDMGQKAHTNWYPENTTMSCMNDINNTSDFRSHWSGSSVSAGNPNHPPASSQEPSSSVPQITQEAKGLGSLNNVSFKQRALQFAPLVVREALKNGLEPALVMAIIEKESSFNADARNPKSSARGLMQLLYRLHGSAPTPEGREQQLLNPEYNVALGCQYLRQIKKNYNFGNDYELIVSSYHDGPGGTRAWKRAKDKGFDFLNEVEAKMVNRLGQSSSPSGKTNLQTYSGYTSKILSWIPKWRNFLTENGFMSASAQRAIQQPIINSPEKQSLQPQNSNSQRAKKDLAARYSPPRQQGTWTDANRIDNLRKRELSKDVTTTLSSPMELAINEFTQELLLGQGQSLMRAYPAFKLYFIEDDSGERTKMSFDDFFSYNTVKSIRVVQSREIAADLCVLELVNISGVLSNRKFRQQHHSDAPRDDHGNIVQENQFAEGTLGENPMKSFLLQEGIQILLKLGFSSDPDKLETAFSGVITSIEFSENEDLVTVVAQSYGIELVQDIKGLEKPKSSLSSGLLTWNFWGFGQNASTSRIFEEMLAEPEVQHFGRWAPREGGNTLYRDLLTNKWRFYPTPQDDNIFAPSPLEELDSLSDGWIFKKYSYTIYRTTIWDIFKEMEMRHPNMIAQPTYYKDRSGERMTMFFGLPNQLYFSRHPNLEEQKAANKLVDEQKKIKEDRLKTVVTELDYRDSISSRGAPSLSKEELLARKKALKSVQDAELNERQVQVKRLEQAKAAGFVKPFRSYHLITSRHHIISNDIRTNSRDVANTIVIKYGSDIEIAENDEGVSLKGQEETFTLKLDNALPAEEIRTQYAQYLNVTNEELAKRYALSLLIQNLRKCYRGDIQIIGNAKIRPCHVCYIMDEQTDMIGAIEVEAVEHVFDQHNGFRTIITPNMLVQAAEWSLLSSAEGMGIVMEGIMRKMMSTDTSIEDSTGGNWMSPTMQIMGAGFSLVGGFLANKIINYTQLAQPVVMSPLLHHGEVFAGGIPVRKTPTSLWSTVFSKWSPLLKTGYKGYIDSIKDDIKDTLSKNLGFHSEGSIGSI